MTKKCYTQQYKIIHYIATNCPIAVKQIGGKIFFVCFVFSYPAFSFSLEFNLKKIIPSKVTNFPYELADEELMPLRNHNFYFSALLVLAYCQWTHICSYHCWHLTPNRLLQPTSSTQQSTVKTPRKEGVKWKAETASSCPIVPFEATTVRSWDSAPVFAAEVSNMTK